MSETPETALGETLQGNLLLAIQSVMTAINQHKEEMAAQRNGDSGRQAEANPSLVQPESSNKTPEVSMTEKLAKFNKFLWKPRSN